MKTTGMSSPVPATVLTVACISFLAFFPATIRAAQNAINVTGDITLKKDANQANTGIHFSNGSYQNAASPWSYSNLDIYFNAVGGKVGIGTDSPDSALTVVSPASSPVRIGDSGCGASFAGIGLFGLMSGCSNYAILGENGKQKNLFINRPADADINFRMNNGDQMVLERFGGLVLDANNTNNGALNHSATTGAGLAFGYNSGEGIASKRTAGGNQWGLDFYTFSTPRLSITSGGNVGIGTTTPGGLLDINTGAGSFQVRNDNGFTPGINLSGGPNPGILRLRNALEVWPSDDSSRAGRVTVGDTTGNATISLDGQTGNIAAKNMPAIKSTQFFGDQRANTGYTHLTNPNDRAVDTLSVNVPSDGYLHITATLDAALYVDASNANLRNDPIYFKLNETTDPQAGVQFIEQSLDTHFPNTNLAGGNLASSGTITLHWTVPTGPGTRSFTTYAYAPNGVNGYGGYYSHTLTVMYFPNSL